MIMLSNGLDLYVGRRKAFERTSIRIYCESIRGSKAACCRKRGYEEMKSDVPQRLFEINDKPMNLMSPKELDEYWMRLTGEHYREPTQEEIDAVLEKFGLK